MIMTVDQSYEVTGSNPGKCTVVVPSTRGFRLRSCAHSYPGSVAILVWVSEAIPVRASEAISIRHCYPGFVRQRLMQRLIE